MLSRFSRLPSRAAAQSSIFYARDVNLLLCGQRGFSTSRVFYQGGDPLRVLFCGTDEISKAALEALIDHQHYGNSNIKSIDVVTRTDKSMGRGHKQRWEPIIKSFALSRGLPVHQIDTFTNWQPPTFEESPEKINLVIAVSFGRLIPQRILEGSKYGGLNMHPSLLPDLKGAAPTITAILKGYKRTGVSVQTLHPNKFDEGQVLAQESVDIPNPDTITTSELNALLAPPGSELLVKTLRDGLYLDPTKVALPLPKGPYNKAYKIGPEHSAVDFANESLEQIQCKNRALIKLLWCTAIDSSGKVLRVMLPRDMAEKHLEEFPESMRESIASLEPGNAFIEAAIGFKDVRGSLAQSVFVKTMDQKILKIDTLRPASKNSRQARRTAISADLVDDPADLEDNPELSVFHHPLGAFNDKARM